ncbi:MAG: tRNA lysidine(34) synthetase TilS [Pyrinomonadaceae bacterium]
MKNNQKRTPGFARRLLTEWRQLKLPERERRVVIAVSGGADSCALLLAFDELIKARRLSLSLCVAHLDHGLRGEAGESDARWVAKLAAELGHECRHKRAAVAERASRSQDNLEQAARRERYEFLARVAREQGAGVVLAGHTLDDQAETVLLALLRGSGADGLGGMSPVRPLDEAGDVLLARPLLSWARRAETAAYCCERGVEPRADTMNEDERFKRVRVRRQLIPLLESFNPRAVAALARAAELLRQDSDALEAQAAELIAEAERDWTKGECQNFVGAGLVPARRPQVERQSADNQSTARNAPARDEQGPVLPLHEDVASLSVEVLRAANGAVRRRALRRWIERERGSLRRLELVHVRAVEQLLEGERGGRVAELPGGSVIERRGGRLYLIADASIADCGIRNAD